MSQFYYYIPTQQRKLSLEACNEAGVGYALEGSKTDRGCSKGPDGQQGVVVCYGDNRDGKLGYFQDQQTWKQVPGKQVWCGVYTDALPTPADLARQDQISGMWVAAGDGSQWLAPTARRYAEEDNTLVWTHNLPRQLTLNEHGDWQPGGVLPQYQRLWEMCVQCEDALFGQSDQDINTNDVAVSALQTNYRVSAVELDLIGVFTEAFRDHIVKALTDLPTWLDWAKKNAMVNQVESDGDNS